MGTPLIPGETNNACSTCFPVDETPLILYASFIGILPGNDWHSGLPDPPNKAFRLTWDYACHWSIITGGFEVHYNTGSGFSNFSIDLVGIDRVFRSVSSGACVKFKNSTLTTPAGESYWSGKATAFYTTPAEKASILNVADKVGIPLGPDTYAEVFPVDISHSNYRLARKKDATMAHILFDFT